MNIDRRKPSHSQLRASAQVQTLLRGLIVVLILVLPPTAGCHHPFSKMAMLVQHEDASTAAAQ